MALDLASSVADFSSCDLSASIKGSGSVGMSTAPSKISPHVAGAVVQRSSTLERNGCGSRHKFLESKGSDKVLEVPTVSNKSLCQGGKTQEPQSVL